MSNNTKSVPAPLTTKLYEYHVISSSCKMPAKCWGRYSHVAIIETAKDVAPPCIIRDTKEVTVLYDSGPQFHGETDRCAFEKAYVLAEKKAERYNMRQYQKHLAQLAGLKVAPWKCLIDGDFIGIYSNLKKGHVVRYDANGKKTGVAVWDKASSKWEHGATIAECKAEIQHKQAVEKARIESENRRKALALIVPKAIDEGLKVMSDLVVDFETARSAGLCRQGIEAFCLRHRFNINEGASIKDVLETGNQDGLKACRKAVEKEILGILT